MCVIPVLGSQKPEDHKFEVNLSYSARFCQRKERREGGTEGGTEGRREGT